jgi:hypothetical protein
MENQPSFLNSEVPATEGNCDTVPFFFNDVLSAIHPNGANVTVVEQQIFFSFSDEVILVMLQFLIFFSPGSSDFSEDFCSFYT